MKKKIPFAYRPLDLETLEEFFIRCGERNLSDLKSSGLSEAEFIEKRCEVMDELMKENRALSMTEEDVKKVAKNKRIGFIKPNE